MNKGRIKRFLDEMEVPEAQRAEILSETTALALKAGATKPGSMMISLFVALMLSGCSLRLFSGFSVIAQIVLAVAIAILIVYGMMKLNSGAWWQFLKPYLTQPLEARGFRFCRHCLYNFRGIPPETEYCPECSVYISKR